MGACAPASGPPATTTVPETTIADTTTAAPTSTTAPAAATTTPTTTSVAQTTTTTLPIGVIQPPEWLGDEEVTKDANGNVILPDPFPEELVDRRFATVDFLPPPQSDEFVSTVGPIPEDVLARSSWGEDCPVSREELSYVTVSFRGFDESAHTGELIVHASAGDNIVSVFEDLYTAGFPIEEMKVLPRPELVPTTGDTNNTEIFACRAVTGGSGWSQHAFGLAIDINPFHNPYLRGDVVLPELAVHYLDRDEVRPGMIVEGDIVTEAFDRIGWGWGGRWRTLKDWQHFSRSGT